MIAGISAKQALNIVGAMRTNPGCLRYSNEDTIAYVLSEPEHAIHEYSLVALVADGMCGHAAGEVASGLAAETILGLFPRLNGRPPEVLAACLLAANQAIVERSHEDPSCRGMGTTCTVLAVHQSAAYLAHIGDSCAYLIRSGLLSRLSEDHSLVGEMVRAGILAQDHAVAGLKCHVIARALGSEERIEPQVFKEGLPIFSGDRFVLCSDGLTDVVDEDTICRTASELRPGDACEELICAALAGGGPDNVSVGVFAMEFSQTG